MNFKKLGAEAILTGMLLPWLVYLTLGLIDAKTANAVQKTQYDYIVQQLESIKNDVSDIKKKGVSHE